MKTNATNADTSKPHAVTFAHMSDTLDAVTMSDSSDAATASGTPRAFASSEAADLKKTASAPSSLAHCTLCPHACALHDGQHGRCHARVARGGNVVSENYGRITSLALDPIEKKPLARYFPGSTVLSVGSYGCNLSCPFCQNARIACASELDVPWREMTPTELMNKALDLAQYDCIGIAYTYNEPLVGFEFVRDCAQLAHECGLKNVLVSNGFINAEPLQKLAPFIDAANIDLKGFSSHFYHLVGGEIAPVQRTIEFLAQTATCHVEITTLVVPGMNDDLQHIDQLAAWIAHLNPEIPLHLSRFFPQHHMAKAQPTPRATMLAAQEVASAHLHTVLLGNM